MTDLTGRHHWDQKIRDTWHFEGPAATVTMLQAELEKARVERDEARAVAREFMQEIIEGRGVRRPCDDEKERHPWLVAETEEP